MAKSTTMTVRLKPEVSDKLKALARDMKRSKAYLASAAIESYVELNAWQPTSRRPSKKTNPAPPGFRMKNSSRGWNPGERSASSRGRRGKILATDGDRLAPRRFKRS